MATLDFIWSLASDLCFTFEIISEPAKHLILYGY